MHLKQPRFTYSACGPFTKNKERIQKFKKTGDSRYIYKNELDKACFQNDMEILKIQQKEQLQLKFWGADLADVQLISKFNTGIKFLLCVIDVLVSMHGLFL